MFTVWNWVFAVIFMVIVIVISIAIGLDAEEFMPGLVAFLIGLVICGAIMGFIGWYHLNTASGIRDMKDYHSELNNGINREITITAEDGREIFYYEGKVDVESNHTDNYIKFESEEGKRYIVYYGIQDTIQIIEK